MTPSVARELVRSGHLVRSLRLAPFVSAVVTTGAFLAVCGGEPHDVVADLRVLALLLALGSGYVLDDGAAVTLPRVRAPRHHHHARAPGRAGGGGVDPAGADAGRLRGVVDTGSPAVVGRSGRRDRRARGRNARPGRAGSFRIATRAGNGNAGDRQGPGTPNA
jgi:hypothetical protein